MSSIEIVISLKFIANSEPFTNFSVQTIVLYIDCFDMWDNTTEIEFISTLAHDVERTLSTETTHFLCSRNWTGHRSWFREKWCCKSRSIGHRMIWIRRNTADIDPVKLEKNFEILLRKRKKDVFLSRRTCFTRKKRMLRSSSLTRQNETR